KAVKVVKYRGEKTGVDITAADLVLSDIFATLKDVAVLNALGVDKISLDGVSIEVEVKLNGDTIDVVSHVTKDGSDSYVAIFFDELEASTFIPAAKGHAVNDIALDKALFVIQPKAAEVASVTAAELPGDLPNLVGWAASDTVNIGGGINVAAILDVKNSGDVADALKTVGISGDTLPFRGTLSVDTFKSMGGKSAGAANALGAADQSSLLAGLSVYVEVPLPTLPAIADLVTISGPAKLSISGRAQDPSGIWAKVPAALASFKPEGDVEISLQFGVKINGAGIDEVLDALISIETGGAKGMTLLALASGAWDKPFGIPSLTLDNGGFKLSIEKSSGKSTDDIAFFATADIAKEKGVKVVADIEVVSGKVTLNYFELDGKFTLKDFPGGSGIPSADKFELDELKLSIHGVEAKTEIGGVQVDAYLFDAGEEGAANWTFAIEQKNFKITELVKAAAKIDVLNKIVIPEAALIISEKGLSGDKDSMPVIAKDMFDDIFGTSAVNVKIPSGIGVLAAFDPTKMGVVGEGLSKIGVHEDAIIMGAITGVFQGTPGINLSLIMEAAGSTSGLPSKMMSFSKAVVPEFFIQWGAEDLYVGLGIAMDVKAGKDTLTIDTKIELEFSEKGVGIDILGEMDGTWNNPFGIHGIAISDLKLKVGIDDVGEVTVGFAGHDKIGKEDIQFATEMKISLEDGLPDGVAFAGSMNVLGIGAIMDIVETLMGLEGKMGSIQIPFFEVHDAKLAFATPGATDPQLGLVSEGFAFSGSFFFMSKELGSVSGSGGTSGLSFKGDIDDIDLDILAFKNNNIDIEINLNPKFIINSEIDLLGAKQIVKLDIEPPHFEFDLTEEMGHFGEAFITVRLDGFDLMKGTFDKNADISIIGEFKSDLVPWMEAEVKKGIDDLKASADAKLDADMASLNAAEAKVDGINKQIAAVRAEDNRAKQRAELKIDEAKKKVSSLKGSYDHDEYEKHHCGSHWTHWACTGYWAVKGAATWLVYEVAEGVLDAVKVAVAAAYDLDPRIAALYAERDIELAGLAIAKAVVEVSKAAEDFVLNALEDIIEEALEHLPFEIDKAIIIGDLRDMIVNDAPLVLDLKFKMFGAPMHEYFAIKLEDPVYDAVSFALLPAIALDKMTEEALSKISPAAGRWFHAHIGAKLAEAEAKVRKEVEGEEAKYKDVLASFENGSAKYKAAYTAQSEAHTQQVQSYEVTDMLGDSLIYSNTYLAIGHSSLCLAVAADGVKVIQLSCKDTEAERWSTSKLDDGYVQLRSKGLCLKARDNTAANQQDPLVLSQCTTTDKHEQWKILSSDGFYDKIVNRDSQKCLHFNSENANPSTAYAVWTSCMGADSQTFRAIADAERPTFHDVESML
ncbi:MAG: ricin-type beta-trefoil lectin domain protein, partial [Thermodesulfobacteriota bacterium]